MSCWPRSLPGWSGGHFNHLPHEFQESFVNEITNAPNNKAKLKVIEKYYALSQAFREAEPEKAEDMEAAFMDILETITKYDGCGIKFQVDREQGLHQNLAAANAFLQLNHYAQYLPMKTCGTFRKRSFLCWWNTFLLTMMHSICSSANQREVLTKTLVCHVSDEDRV